MGSINCKEYKTDGNQHSSNNQTNGGNETSGKYQSTCEAKMSDEDIDYTEVEVCNEEDLPDNEMRQFSLIGNHKVLLVKQNGKVSALGPKCTHYGAPLSTGVLGDGRVRCPWHGACFNAETGDIEDFPGLDSLPCYKATVQNGLIKVKFKGAEIEKAKRLKNMAKRSQKDRRIFIIIGGGPAGGICAETLRQEGFTGRIIMVCREPYPPYDRVKISKALDTQIESIQFREMPFYEEHDIELKIGIEAGKVDSETKTVYLSNGETMKFDKMFIATGSDPVKPPIKGIDIRNVFTLRDIKDGNVVVRHIKPSMHAICLGSSFISLEAAAFLVGKVKSVTVIGRSDVPLKNIFGKEIGHEILELFKQQKVQMLMNNNIQEVKANDENRVSSVVLENGTKLQCDLLVVGTGTRCSTKFLESSGIEINSNGSIDTDMFLRTNVSSIYVGGDIANAPVFSIANQRATIGHYQLAQYHGRIAAINMAGNIKHLQAVPFFFTMLFGKGFRYAGYGEHKDIFIDGSLTTFKFAAYYLDDYKNVLAVSSCGRDPIVAQFAELQAQGKRLHLTDIVEAPSTTSWTEMLKTPSCVS